MTRRQPDTARTAAELAPLLRAREDRSRAAQERRTAISLEQAEVESRQRIREIRDERHRRRASERGHALPPVPRRLLEPAVSPWSWELDL